jgi:anti-sigma regulatory factor (Ser/Thr protein kinase)
MSKSIQLALDSSLEAGRVARGAIADGYPSLREPARTDLMLLVTELVTNAVRHGGDRGELPIRLELERVDGHVHVRVEDPGTTFIPPPAILTGDAAGGWGLFLVDQVADRWGVSPASAGTCVWFELAL